MTEAPDPAVELLDELLELATDLAAAAAARHRQGDMGTVDTKSSASDPVTQVDRDSEHLIVAGITAARPEDGLLGEEGAARHGSSGFRWVIDPLDGTVNYVYGVPSHAVSIAVEFNDIPVVAVVHDSALDDVYRARRGGGATLNGETIRVSDTGSLAGTLLGTGFAYDAQQRSRQGRVLAELISQVRDVRRAGSCAVDLCWTAMGRLDAFYETGPNRWDVAAGMLMIREAGGVATYDESSHRILGAPPAVWNELTEAVAAAEKAASSS
ncbi:MAG: inositol monophosphatase family protein [Actinomycetota bacterium]|jgi:myo-inositol-1(or 4)-monophosphatase|nr:inositol monophosphatase family protein [Actinomycetota bacterium]